MENLSNDIKLIIECCKENKNLNLLQELISNIKNWNSFISLSYSHGVFSLVYKCLKNFSDIITSDVLESMKLRNLDIIKQNMMMTSELTKVLKILEENNIEAIPFKGPVLSQLAYGDVVSRQYVDLDILFKIEKISTLKEIMNKLDFKRNLELTPDQESIWMKNAHDISFISSKNINIEFHWSLLDLSHPINLNNINFFNNKNKITINNVEMNCISNEEFLIYLCIHGAKHLYERIEWVVDLDKFIRTQNINWEKIENLLENHNSKRFFYLGIYLTKYLYNTPININFNFSNEIKQVAEYIWKNWSNSGNKMEIKNLKYMLKLFFNTKDKLKYINKVYFKPSFNEYWYISLPSYLHFLYYPLRQYLLIKKHFFN